MSKFVDSVIPLLAEAAGQGFVVGIRGDCMAPLLADNMQVLVRAQRRYWPGDVLVVAGEGGLVVHRLIGGYRWHGRLKILTQADLGNRPDRARLPEEVLGRVCGGDCAAAVIDVPLRYRLWALSRFFFFMCLKMAHMARYVWREIFNRS